MEHQIVWWWRRGEGWEPYHQPSIDIERAYQGYRAGNKVDKFRLMATNGSSHHSHWVTPQTPGLRCAVHAYAAAGHWCIGMLV